MGDVAALTWPLTRPGGPLPLPSNRTRRCLFGPVDHENAKVHLEQQMAKLRQQDKLRWNFDFETGRPLKAGRYKWEKVGGPSDEDNNNSSSSGGSDTQDADVKSAKEEQTHITDFMRKRKSSNLKDIDTQQTKIRRRSST